MECRWTALARLQSEEGLAAEHRSRPRFVAREVICERGRVEDFSATGLRIRYTKAQRFVPGDTVWLELYSNLGQHTCQAEVVWVRKEGFRHHEVGFRFSDPEKAKEMQLFRLGYDPLGDSPWSIQ